MRAIAAGARGPGLLTYGRCGLRSSSVSASALNPEQALAAVQRAFVMQCHPDFFLAHPRQRHVNTANLAVLHDFLEGGGGSWRAAAAGRAAASTSTSLYFFFKSPRAEETPPRVTLALGRNPADALARMWEVLQSRGIDAPKPPTAAAASAAAAAAAGGTAAAAAAAAAASRARARAWADAAGRNRNGGASAEWDFEREPSASVAARRTTVAQDLAGFVSQLSTPEMAETIAYRKAAAERMDALVELLRQRLGVEDVVNRCGWAAANMVMVLNTLLACSSQGAAAGRHAARFPGFKVVFTLGTHGEPVDCDEGEIRLSPGDPPLLWQRVLSRLSPEVIEARRRRLLLRRELEEEAMRAFHGMDVAPGFSCPQISYDAASWPMPPRQRLMAAARGETRPGILLQWIMAGSGSA